MSEFGFPRRAPSSLSPPRLPIVTTTARPELPRLQVPPLPIVRPSFPHPTHLHWKLQAVPTLESPQATPPPNAPMSRMRMVANFFSSESNPNPTPTPPPHLHLVGLPPPTLPSLHELLAKQTFQHASPVVTVPVELERPHLPFPSSTPHFARHPPAPIHVPFVSNSIPHPPSLARFPSEESTMSTSTYSVGMRTPLPSPSASLSPSSPNNKNSKRRERWTEDEHARFMEGLNRYGRKWKKIQAYVQTKTAVQVRTHAYGYFAKLLRNMPEDDAAWELAEEMSSLPGAVLKGPANGKRRSEPKTDEAGMEVLRRFVFCRKKTESVTTRSEDQDMETASVSSIQSLLVDENQAPSNRRPMPLSISTTEQWNSDETDADPNNKRQRLH